MGRFFKQLFISLAAFLVATILFLVIISAGIALAVVSFTPKMEPIARGTILEINMDEAFIDAPQSPSLFDLGGLAFGYVPTISTLSMLRALEVAADDPNIAAISLKLDGLEYLPLAAAEELRSALITFRSASDVPIYAYAESYSQTEYYLATVADKIFIHPLGQIEWQGVAMNTIFYGDMIKGLGAKVEVFRPEECYYKSAVEPFTRGDMSPESRRQNLRLVNTLWGGVVGEVAAARDIETEKLREVAANRIIIEAEESQELKMVDIVAYEDIYIKELESDGVKSDKGEVRKVTLANYASRIDQQNAILNEEMFGMGGDKIAVIYLDGTIADGRSQSNGDSNIVGSTTVVNQLREVREDDDVKGVVVRVNSPGGSAMAADVIWREMDLLKSEKMVVVSMGSYAASGGYYVSAPADVIVADRYTLTGSIGVYGMMIDYAEALSRHLHINIDGVGSSPSADFGRAPRAITPLERAAMMRSVDQIYDAFTNKVSVGRNLPIGVVNALSGGQVWSGVEAESCGLVDGIGGLKMALSLVVERCGLADSDYKIIEIAESPDELELLLSSLGLKIESIFTNGILGSIERKRSQITSELRAFENSGGVMMLSPERLE